MSANIDKTILDDFVQESLSLVDQCLELLETIEQDPSEVEKLSEFANLIDRVMGGAKSLALGASAEHALHLIGDYCAICKSVGYQGAKIQNNDQMYFITTALLLDAVEMIKVLFAKLEISGSELKKIFTTTFLDRLKWISFQFDEMEKKSRGSADKMQQNEIDELLKKLGL
ncbi:MAG: hypothetical protein ACK5V3_13975 [Bdellovibrionales bacterium]